MSVSVLLHTVCTASCQTGAVLALCQCSAIMQLGSLFHRHVTQARATAEKMINLVGIDVFHFGGKEIRLNECSYGCSISLDKLAKLCQNAPSLHELVHHTTKLKH